MEPPKIRKFKESGNRPPNKRDVVRIAVVNFKPEIKSSMPNKTATLEKIKLFTIQAVKQGADIIVFPELALTSYSAFPSNKAHELAEPIPGSSTNTIQKVTSQYNVYVAFGMIEKKDGKLYNAVPLVGPDGVLGTYRKVHLFKPEESWATPGDEYFPIHTPWGAVGIGICYDNYCFPEVPRIYAVRGAHILLNPTAFPKFPGVNDHKDFYLTMLGARSIENNMFIASANMVGTQGKLTFLGCSMIIGPKQGKMSYHIYAGPLGDEEGIATATLDLSSLDKLSIAVKTILVDRRPDTYKSLTEA